MKPSVKTASPVEKALEQMRAALLEQARTELEKLSPTELMAIAERKAVRVASERTEKPKDWSKETHTCPNCGETKPVLPDFGVKVVRGKERKHSWCRRCRATTNYYQAKRKYKTRSSVL